MRKVVICLLLFVLSLGNVIAQSSLHHIDLISSESGLNDIVVNDIVGDENGVIWVGTENGLSRFINGRFELYHEYSERIKITGHTITKLYLDSRCRMWIGDRLQGISVQDFKRNTSTLFRNAEPKKQLLGKEVLDLKEDSKGNIWALIFPNILTKFSPDLEILHTIDLSSETSIELNELIALCLVNDMVVLSTLKKGLCSYNEKERVLLELEWVNRVAGKDGYCSSLYALSEDKFLFKSKNKVYKIDLKNKSIYVLLSEVESSHTVSFCNQNQGSLLLVQFPKIWKLSSDLEIKARMDIVLPDRLSHLQLTQKKCFLNSDNILFIGTDQGILKLNIERQHFKITQKSKSLNSPSLSGIYLRTLYRLKNNDLVSTYVNENKIDILKVGNDEFSGTIQSVESIDFVPNYRSGYRANGVLEKSDGTLFIATYKGVWIRKPGENKAYERVFKTRGNRVVQDAIWSMHELSPDLILVGTRQHGFHYLDLAKNEVLEPRVKIIGEGTWSQNNSIWQLYTDSKNEVWVITSQGLFKLLSADKEEIRLKQFLALKDYSLWAISESDEGEIWVGSIEHGIHCVDTNGIIKAHLDFKSGLTSMSICALVKDKKGRLWASSPLSLSLIDSKERKVIRNFSSKEDLQLQGFNYRSGILDVKGNVYFGSKMGLLYFNPEEVLQKPSNSESVLVLNRINGKEQTFNFSLPNEIRLSDGIRSLDLEPALIDYQDPEKNKYFYRLKGVEKNWNELSGPVPRIFYLNLVPGSYILEIKAETPSGVEAVNRINIPIEVIPYFWETTWFSISLIGLSALIILYFLRLRWLSSKSEARLLESQMTSLRAQMNPHFFFNALNSIQDYIFHKDSEKAANYMSGFAKLLRQILDNSSERFITLREEVIFLSQYLELESLRFEHQMSYSIQVQKGIDKDQTKIPNMLVQPIIENSVKHGLAPLKDKMQLTISFLMREGHLICEVDDNGVGRDVKAKSIHTHNSKGIKTVEERMALLSVRQKAKMKLIFDDKKDDKGNAVGTKVVLILS